MNCNHREKQYRSEVIIFYLNDKEIFMADIRIFCANCNMPFMFKGVPLGMKHDGVAMSVNGQELRARIVPADMERSPVEVLLEDTIDQRMN